MNGCGGKPRRQERGQRPALAPLKASKRPQHSKKGRKAWAAY